MAKKKRNKMTAEEWKAWEARSDEVLRKLQERIDYHAARLKAKGQSA